jgi:hypothetical protein
MVNGISHRKNIDIYDIHPDHQGYQRIGNLGLRVEDIPCLIRSGFLLQSPRFMTSIYGFRSTDLQAQ